MQYRTIFYVFAAMLAGTATAASVNAEAPNAAAAVEARQPEPAMDAGRADGIARLRARALLEARRAGCGDSCDTDADCQEAGLFEETCSACKDASLIKGGDGSRTGNVCMTPSGNLYRFHF